MAYESYGPGVYGPYFVAGAPVAGTNAVQTVTFGGTITGGSFTLSLDGVSTGAITHTGAAMTGAAMATAMNAALDAKFGTAQIVASAGSFAAGVGTMLLTFSGSNAAKRAWSAMTASSALTGTAPTIAVAITTPGVEATGRNAPKGALVVDVTNGKSYQTTGPAGAPVWGLVGAQT